MKETNSLIKSTESVLEKLDVIYDDMRQALVDRDLPGFLEAYNDAMTTYGTLVSLNEQALDAAPSYKQCFAGLDWHSKPGSMIFEFISKAPPDTVKIFRGMAFCVLDAIPNMTEEFNARKWTAEEARRHYYAPQY